ncbi:MAG TPA: serine hydrolase domain-containing protein, partial [Candidatus Thermoplasmatota archaeon]|nr:serine hydrolase domain-containing protein [Candidatus Thermoplasmatota archaeon]
DITVAMLLDHTAGWGRPADKFLWGEAHVEIATTLGVPTPPPAWRIAQYMLGEKLSYEPGSNDQYCNMCYLMLGLVAESAEQADIRALLEAYVFRPLEVSGHVEGGYGRVEDRNPREPFYMCEWADAPSVYEPGKTGCAADVTFALENLIAVGGIISTTSAAVAVYEVHESVFSLDVGPVHTNGHSGSLPGTATFVGTVVAPGVGEVQYAAFFNGHDALEIDWLGVYMLEFAILAAASAWGATETVLR